MNGPTIGIDFGGTGTKAALVSVDSGELLTERFRIPTPHPATPESMVPVMAELIQSAGKSTAVGITIPSVVQRGVVLTAANIDDSWIGVDAAEFFSSELDRQVVVVNDADAAGIAEMRFGAGRGCDGVVIVLTLGTGIGSAVFVDGILVPNTELGHLEFRGADAEKYAAASVRVRKDLSWKKWGHRVNRYFQMVEELFTPTLFIIGGGVSKKAHKYLKYIDVRAEVRPAMLRNKAGVVGAAMAAYESTQA